MVPSPGTGRFDLVAYPEVNCQRPVQMSGTVPARGKVQLHTRFGSVDLRVISDGGIFIHVEPRPSSSSGDQETFSGECD